MGIGPQRLGTAKGFTPCGSPMKQNKEALENYKKKKIDVSQFPNFNQSTDTIVNSTGTGSLSAIRNFHNLRHNNLNNIENTVITQDEDGNYNIMTKHKKK
tara:strand:+ start:155 stop:454 length:300 start_codon:yes stop_codon:yes gene_type:complete